MFGAMGGTQPDVEYGPGEDIGMGSDYTDGGYQIETTVYTGDDIGSGGGDEGFTTDYNYDVGSDYGSSVDYGASGTGWG